MLRFKTINLLAILAIAILLFFYAFSNISIFWAALVLGFWGIITMLGSSLITWNYHLKSFNCNNTILKNEVAITFDDGPNEVYTPKVLDLLKKYNAKATFFCIGEEVEKQPELFRQLIAEGHTVGNHTFSHSNGFGFFSTQRVLAELRKANTIVNEVAGLEMQLYRPAFGLTNPSIKKALTKIDLKSIGWNKRSFDTTGLSEATILKRVTRNLKKGDIILLHDKSEKTLRVLEQLLLFLQTNKMHSVTVDRLLEIEAYA